MRWFYALEEKKQCCWNVTQLLSKIVFAMGGGLGQPHTFVEFFHTSITNKIK